MKMMNKKENKTLVRFTQNQFKKYFKKFSPSANLSPKNSD